MDPDALRWREEQWDIEDPGWRMRRAQAREEMWGKTTCQCCNCRTTPLIPEADDDY